MPGRAIGAVQSVDRAMRILHAFNVDTPELGVSELAAILETHESTASRLASTLAAWGMLRKDPATGKYQLGIGLVTLAGMVAAHLDLRTVARPHLFRLRERTRETVTLACWDVDDAVNIEQVPSLNAVAHAGPVGRRNPPHCTAAGKAILAYLPEKRVAELAAKGLPRFTPKTICDQATLQREMERVRSQGYAVNTEEWEDGLNVVGAPVWNHMDEVEAALCISGPAFRMTSARIPELGRLVKQVADEVSKEMGHIPPR